MVRRIAFGFLGIAALMGVWTACVGDDPGVAPDEEGAAGKKCFSDGTCHQGLGCTNGICVALPDAASSSSSSGAVVAPDASSTDSGLEAGLDAGFDAGFDAGPDAATCQPMASKNAKYPRCPLKAPLSIVSCDSEGPECCPGTGCVIGGNCPPYADFIKCFASNECPAAGQAPTAKKCCLTGTVDGGNSCGTSLTTLRSNNSVVPICTSGCDTNQLELCDTPDAASTCSGGRTCRASAIDLPNGRRQIVYVCVSP